MNRIRLEVGKSFTRLTMAVGLCDVVTILISICLMNGGKFKEIDFGHDLMNILIHKWLLENQSNDVYQED